MEVWNRLNLRRARYYHPQLRRFLNQDTVLGSITTPASLNRFAYANGNPVSGIDPFGTMTLDVEPNTGFGPGTITVVTSFDAQSGSTSSSSGIPVIGLVAPASQLPGAVEATTAIAAETGITVGTAVAMGAEGLAVLAISGDSVQNPDLVSFRRYDYVSKASEYMDVGITKPTTFAAPLSDPLMSSGPAGLQYSLPGAPRDAYYIITVDPSENPYIGPTVTAPVPSRGQPGGGNEVEIPGPKPSSCPDMATRLILISSPVWCPRG